MYFSGSLRDHVCGWLGGMIWCVGLAFSLIASGQAGYAISYGLGQGATIIAVIWGVFIWREFASAPAGTNKLLLTMFISYIVGIVLIIAANQLNPAPYLHGAVVHSFSVVIHTPAKTLPFLHQQSGP